jgi:hypothetical protein
LVKIRNNVWSDRILSKKDCAYQILHLLYKHSKTIRADQFVIALTNFQPQKILDELEILVVLGCLHEVGLNYNLTAYGLNLYFKYRNKYKL